MPKTTRQDIDNESVSAPVYNIFADLGLPDPEIHLLKASLVVRIHQTLDEKGWTQAQAAKKMGIKQPDVSRILRGRFRDYSVERLMRFLARLGCKVDIVVRSGKRSKGKGETGIIHVGT
jgi:predicted XRE-type DNA-binding protein